MRTPQDLAVLLLLLSLLQLATATVNSTNATDPCAPEEVNPPEH